MGKKRVIKGLKNSPANEPCCLKCPQSSKSQEWHPLSDELYLYNPSGHTSPHMILFNEKVYVHESQHGPLKKWARWATIPLNISILTHPTLMPVWVQNPSTPHQRLSIQSSLNQRPYLHHMKGESQVYLQSEKKKEGCHWPPWWIWK